MHGAWQISIGTLLPFPKKIMFLDSVPRWSRLVNFSPLQSTIIGKKNCNFYSAYDLNNSINTHPSMEKIVHRTSEFFFNSYPAATTKKIYFCFWLRIFYWSQLWSVDLLEGIYKHCELICIIWIMYRAYWNIYILCVKPSLYICPLDLLF